MVKVVFLGAGSFGTALALHMANKGAEVRLWDRKPQLIEDINTKRRNTKYFKDIPLSENITGYKDLAEAVKDCPFIVLAVPSQAVRDMARAIKGLVDKNAIVVSIAKGLEVSSEKRLSQVIEEEINNPVVVLSGPSHAEEVVLEIPTSLVVTSREMDSASRVQDLFMTSNFRVYTNEDIIGVEVGGAVKNVIALATGICDGIGYGDNARAALITRGMKEIMRIGVALGGKAETFSGLTGMGDLIVTCTSPHSRNRKTGYLIGKGISLEKAVEEVGMVVEGVKACRVFYNIKEKEKVEMPITAVLYQVLFQGMEPKEAVLQLMNREKKDENY